ncbi:hypothetical protein [Sicyoidochytrium minutum DNA virus]|nr:hypothetical protein [Sicyoidochytrium minutum DNA virus]
MPSAVSTPGKDVGKELLLAAHGVQTERSYPKDWSAIGDKHKVLGHWIFEDDGSDKGQPVTISVQLSKEDKADDESGVFRMAIVQRLPSEYSEHIHYGLIEYFGDNYDWVLDSHLRDAVGCILDDINECYIAEKNEKQAAKQ